MKDSSIKDVIKKEKGIDTSKILVEIISKYTEPSFGSISKHDIDLLMFNCLMEAKLITPNPTIYEVMTKLRVTRSKARNLIYESQIRATSETELEEKLKEVLKTPLIQRDGEVISLEIDNPYLIDYLRKKLKDLKCISDGSFHSEIVKMSRETFCKLYYACLNDKKKKVLDSDLETLGIKDKKDIPTILSKLFLAAAKGFLGKTGENLAEYCIDYISDVSKCSNSVVKAPEGISSYFDGWPTT